MGDTAIATPVKDMGELDFEQIGRGANELYEFLETKNVKNVVVDLLRTDYCGSTALAYFLKFWKRVRRQNGHMAFCNVSAHEKEILELTRLDTIWSICESKAAAIETVNNMPTGSE